MFFPGYYSGDELKEAGFKAIGENVSISKNCTIVGLSNISIGDNVRIDGYCSIFAAGTGYITLGSFIHIGSYSMLSGGSGIVMQDYSGLSQGVKIYSRTDDYSGKYLTNPTVPAQYTGISEGEVVLKKHVIVGSGTVILPKVTIGEGSSVGALSLVTKNLESWGMYFGSPVKRLKSRSQNILKLEKELIKDLENASSTL